MTRRARLALRLLTAIAAGALLVRSLSGRRAQALSIEPVEHPEPDARKPDVEAFARVTLVLWDSPSRSYH